MVGHHLRREPAFRYIKNILDSGSVGVALQARGIGTVKTNKVDWRIDREKCPGGAVEQLGIHLVDLFAYFFGSFENACGELVEASDGRDWAHLDICFDCGTRTSIDACFCGYDYLGVEIICTKGVIASDGRTVRVINEKKSGKLKPDGLHPRQAQFVEFADCVERGLKPETDATIAGRAVWAVEQINRKNT